MFWQIKVGQLYGNVFNQNVLVKLWSVAAVFQPQYAGWAVNRTVANDDVSVVNENKPGTGYFEVGSFRVFGPALPKGFPVF